MDKTFFRKISMVIGAVVLGAAVPAAAKTLCVNPGRHGCFATIGSAVAAAQPFDEIDVASGVFAEDVVIGKPLALVGAGPNHTTIDARGMSNGIYVDGIDNPGLSVVSIRGFTVQNALFEGILVANAAFITVSGNSILNNNLALDVTAGKCPGLPAFETLEQDDCGEGVHLLGVSHALVGDNEVASNAGGILVSDDTALAADNLITGNNVHDNPFDCGITLASHPPATMTGASSPLGIDRTTVANNTSQNNGTVAPGAGAGVGIFGSVTGARAYGNIVVGNSLTGNGLPGVAIHGHTTGQNLNDNMILYNTISGNGADTGDSATPGTTGINVFSVSPAGVGIANNTINDENNDVVVNTGALVSVHLNNLLGGQTGIANIGSGNVDGTENYWGCNKGPGTTDCSTVSGAGVISAPFLTSKAP